MPDSIRHAVEGVAAAAATDAASLLTPEDRARRTPEQLRELEALVAARPEARELLALHALGEQTRSVGLPERAEALAAERGLTWREIGLVLGVTPQAAVQRLGPAREAVRETNRARAAEAAPVGEPTRPAAGAETMSVAEAAEALGIAVGTLRQRIARALALPEGHSTRRRYEAALVVRPWGRRTAYDVADLDLLREG